jgi:hypothetical protein
MIQQIVVLPAVVFAVTLSMVHPQAALAQKILPDDPLIEDDDRLDTPVKPKEVDLPDLYDLVVHSAFDLGKSPVGSEASNINTLDEVPDSTWFTNRHGAERMSLEKLRRGPNRGSGPDPKGKWWIFAGKSQGLTPGFFIRDETGERYVIKVDPIDFPEIASAAEAIATKIFYAIGYHVPENYIVYRDANVYEIEPGTRVTDQFGDKVPLTRRRLSRMTRKVPVLPDGRVRLLASKYFPGVPVGPFLYYGTRGDDPNDIIPHEDRRELRALRLFAAWTNHDDTRAHNSQDVWVEQDGKHFVRHYLMDFGSTFGSGSVKMQDAFLTYGDTFLDIGKHFIGLGLSVPRYRHAKWPEFPEYKAVGRWESELFDPAQWLQNYTNPAFARMTARDAFWAAKIIMRFTNAELRAIVETGEYSRPEDTEYFLRVLIERQIKCGRYGINGVNPLDDFRWAAGAVEFENLSEKYDFSTGETKYRVQWFIYDNENDITEALGEPRVQSETRSDLRRLRPSQKRDHLFPMLQIHSLNEEFPHWNTPVLVYLRPNTEGYDVVSIERVSPGAPVASGDADLEQPQ